MRHTFFVQFKHNEMQMCPLYLFCTGTRTVFSRYETLQPISAWEQLVGGQHACQWLVHLGNFFLAL